MGFFIPAYYGIKPEASRAMSALIDAQREAISNKEYWPCLNNPYFYQDYDALGFDGPPRSLTEDECEALCYGCPLLKQCYDFAVANNEQHGIWGGVDFTPKLDTLF
jgi:hypothetical protein